MVRQILAYYKLALIDSVLVLITTIFGIIILFRSFAQFNLSELIVIGCIIPIIVSLIFVVLDIKFISNYHDIDNAYSKEYKIILTITKRRLRKTQHLITNIIYFFSLTVIIASILIIIYMIYNKAVEVAISYLLLLVVAAIHTYVVNKAI